MTWAEVPTPQLDRLLLFGYREIANEDGLILYEHQSIDFCIIVDSTKPVTLVYFDSYDDYIQF